MGEIVMVRQRLLLASLLTAWVGLVLACAGGGGSATTDRKKADPDPAVSTDREEADPAASVPAPEPEPPPAPRKKAPFPPPAPKTVAADKARKAHKVWQDLQGLRPEVV